MCTDPPAMAIPRVALLWLCLFTLLPPCAAFAKAPSAAQVDATARAGVRALAETQKIVDEWAEEKPGLQARIRELKAQVAWLEFRNRRHEAYIAERERKVAALERRKEEAARLGRELAPFLETTLQRLDAFVQADLSFLPQEREARLAFLHESLDDFRLGLGEKLRRVLEALQVEAEYGRTVEAGTMQLPPELAGGTGPVRAQVYRLGRLGLFYVTPDGASVGRYDPAARKWVAVHENEDDLVETLRLAMDMAQRRRSADFLEFPLAPTPAAEAGSAPAVSATSGAVRQPLNTEAGQ